MAWQDDMQTIKAVHSRTEAALDRLNREIDVERQEREKDKAYIAALVHEKAALGMVRDRLIGSIDAERQGREKDKAHFGSRIAVLEREKAGLEHVLRQLDYERRARVSERNEAAARVRGLESQIRQAGELAQAGKDSLGKSESDLANAKRANKGLQSTLDTTAANYQRVEGKLRQDLEQAASDQRVLRTQLTRVTNELTDAKNSLTALNSSFSQETRNLGTELADARHQLDNAVKAQETERARNSKRVSDDRNALNEANNRAASLQGTLTRTVKDKGEAEATINKVKEELRNVHGARAAANDQLAKERRNFIEQRAGLERQIAEKESARKALELTIIAMSRRRDGS